MKRLLAILLVLTFALPASGTLARDGKTIPPQSNAYGKSLDEWMKLYFTWLVSGSGPDHVGRVKFLPLPSPDCEGEGTPADPAICTGQLAVTLKPGTPFVLPVVAAVGETYLDESQDDPLDPSIFTESDALVKLDGRHLIDSRTDDLNEFLFGPVDFDAPIVYAEPTGYGSTSAIWTQGIGFVSQPLSVGTHTLTLHSELYVPQFNLGVEYNNTWTITVKR